CPPGRDHPGDHGSCRRRRSAELTGEFSMAATETKTNVGRIEEIQGVVIEAVFPDEHLPEINHALTIDRGEQGTLVLEVQQHLGDDRVRAVAMDTTDGLARGTEV